MMMSLRIPNINDLGGQAATLIGTPEIRFRISGRLRLSAVRQIGVVPAGNLRDRACWLPPPSPPSGDAEEGRWQ